MNASSRSRRPGTGGAFVIALLTAALGMERAAQAQSYRDPFDVSRGAVVTNASSTPKELDASGILGADTPGEKHAGVAVFNQGGLDFVEFATKKPVTVEGVELFVAADNDDENAPRSVAEFNLLADCDGDGSYERALVEHAKPTVNWAANVYRFAPVTAAAFRAEFLAGFRGPDHLAGPRIVELDAMSVYEPFNWAWGAAVSALVLGGAGVLFYAFGRKKISAPVRPIVAERTSFPRAGACSLASFGAAALCLGLLLATCPMMAMTWDEGNALLRAERIAEWFGALTRTDDGGFAHAVSEEGLREGWPYTVAIEGHPALYGIAIAAGRAAGDNWLPPLSAARLGPMMLFSLAIGALMLRLWQEYSPAAALAGGAAIVTMPRVFGHAHTINGDAVLMSCWMFAWAAFPPALARPRMAAVWGVLLGLTMSSRFSGWLAILPFVAWSCLYDRRRAARTLAVGLPVALLTFVVLNPPVWPDPLGGLATFFDMNLHRRLNVGTQFFGVSYGLTHPLPWYNSLYWTAATVPAGTLLLGAVGVASAVRGWRDGRGALLLLNWGTLLGVRALPCAPPHDAERLILASFPFFGALAGVGCHSVLSWVHAQGPSRQSRPCVRSDDGAKAGATPARQKAAAVIIVLLLAGSASSVAWYAPQWLSYYSLAGGGLGAAARAGMEPTYYWDSLDSQVLDWLHEHTDPAEKIKFEHLSAENLVLLRRWGLLRRATEETDAGHYRWYVLQRRPSYMSAAARYLDDHETPAFTKTVRPPDAGWGPWRLDVPLLKVFTYEQFERARGAVEQQPSPQA